MGSECFEPSNGDLMASHECVHLLRKHQKAIQEGEEEKIERKNEKSREVESCVTEASPETKEKKRKNKKEMKKRKSEVDTENQRITHIAVERNRRRAINDHLDVLRSLMPPSYVGRGDQASVVGGAIEFVKVLEHILVSRDCSAAAATSLFVTPQFTEYSGLSSSSAEGVDVEATFVRGHVNLKVLGRWRYGQQLIKAIAAMEELRLTVLHLNVTSIGPSAIIYTFNLKVEDDCEMASAEDIAAAAHQIFSFHDDGGGGGFDHLGFS